MSDEERQEETGEPAGWEEVDNPYGETETGEDEFETQRPEEPPEEKKYELTPEEATNFDKRAGFFDRKKTLVTIMSCAGIVAIAGTFYSINKEKEKKEKEAERALNENTVENPPDFLSRERDKAAKGVPPPPEGAAAGTVITAPDGTVTYAGGPPYQAGINNPPAGTVYENGVPVPPPGYPPAAQNGYPVQNGYPAQSAPSGGGGAYDSTISRNMAHLSRLAPTEMDGRLFSGGGGSSAGAQGGYPPAGAPANTPPGYPPPAQSSGSNNYAAQNNQEDKKEFYPGPGGGSSTLAGGYYLGDDTIWMGSIIQGVLITGINTDLPGDVMARVSQNVYDSRTGRKLLIPQGTILIAKYNSSISYAQSRVQIVWSTITRPDGFQMEIGGMNGVNRQGMSGQEAIYNENWFQYLKAAGIVTLFSVANAKMTESAAKYGSNETALAVSEANAEMVKELGGNLIERALDIQPTLTVDAGTKINIMLNKNLYLPPVEDFPVKEKYKR
jgi:type IV secretion system protein VirB10